MGYVHSNSATISCSFEFMHGQFLAPLVRVLNLFISNKKPVGVRIVKRRDGCCYANFSINFIFQKKQLDSISFRIINCGLKPLQEVVKSNGIGISNTWENIFSFSQTISRSYKRLLSTIYRQNARC